HRGRQFVGGGLRNHALLDREFPRALHCFRTRLKQPVRIGRETGAEEGVIKRGLERGRCGCRSRNGRRNRSRSWRWRWTAGGRRNRRPAGSDDRGSSYHRARWRGGRHGDLAELIGKRGERYRARIPPRFVGKKSDVLLLVGFLQRAELAGV